MMLWPLPGTEWHTQQGTMVSLSAYQAAMCASDMCDEIYDASTGSHKSSGLRGFAVLWSVWCLCQCTCCRRWDALTPATARHQITFCAAIAKSRLYMHFKGVEIISSPSQHDAAKGPATNCQIIFPTRKRKCRACQLRREPPSALERTHLSLTASLVSCAFGTNV